MNNKKNKNVKKTTHKKKIGEKIIAMYEFKAEDIPVRVTIKKNRDDYVPIYVVNIKNISEATEMVLEDIKYKLINEVNILIEDIRNPKKSDEIEKRFEDKISILVQKYFPEVDKKTIKFMASYLTMKSLKLGKIELLLHDNNLEEIAVNGAYDNVWVYHKKYEWLKTNIKLKSPDIIYKYAASIGRRVGKEITILNPLMDATLKTGDRVNATLKPISSFGNTITIRKFARKPWTITDMINNKTITPEAASIIWLSVQYELSTLITGGTASGKTSMLNVISSFFPPNQRIISIEDTREITLPKFLHWVPLSTRLKNSEGKGGVSMLDLMVNSLRMRPDRIIVGEIRRQAEAEVMFEAMHTGHSVYATVHANNAQETIVRLTSPPINIPKSMLPAISLIVVQFRNRRLGYRRTFQLAEILNDGNQKTLMQWEAKSDKLKKIAESSSLIGHIKLYTGMSKNEINRDLSEKISILKWLSKHNINMINDVGKIMAEYYTNKEYILNIVKKNKYPSSIIGV